MNHRVFVVLLLLSIRPDVLASPGWLEQLNQSVRQQLGEQVENMALEMKLEDSKYKIDLPYLDPRLNLATCQQPLKITPPQPLNLGRNHIKVSCQSDVAWAINVPVNIKLWAKVVVINQPVSKGLTLKAQHLDYKRRDLSQLRNGYYLKKELVIGKQSKRSLAGQTVMNSHVILPALMVRKGDHVMIEASRGSMSVKMPGEALGDGREGRQIRVRNTRSQRIVQARVVAHGLVQVQF